MPWTAPPNLTAPQLVPQQHIGATVLGSKTKDPREAAARALCEHEGQAADMQFEGRPMWMSYLEEVDVVLEAIGWAEQPLEGEPGMAASHAA